MSLLLAFVTTHFPVQLLHLSSNFPVTLTASLLSHSMWVCTHSLSTSLGAVLLLPLSILSNELLVSLSHSLYVTWINKSLIQGESRVTSQQVTHAGSGERCCTSNSILSIQFLKEEISLNTWNGSRPSEIYCFKGIICLTNSLYLVDMVVTKALPTVFISWPK